MSVIDKIVHINFLNFNGWVFLPDWGAKGDMVFISLNFFVYILCFFVVHRDKPCRLILRSHMEIVHAASSSGINLLH